MLGLCFSASSLLFGADGDNSNNLNKPNKAINVQNDNHNNNSEDTSNSIDIDRVKGSVCMKIAVFLDTLLPWNGPLLNRSINLHSTDIVFPAGAPPVVESTGIADNSRDSLKYAFIHLVNSINPTAARPSILSADSIRQFEDEAKEEIVNALYGFIDRLEPTGYAMFLDHTVDIWSVHMADNTTNSFKFALMSAISQ